MIFDRKYRQLQVRLRRIQIYLNEIIATSYTIKALDLVLHCCIQNYTRREILQFNDHTTLALLSSRQIFYISISWRYAR